MAFEGNIVTRILKGIDQRWRQVLLVVSAFANIVYVIILLACFFLVQSNQVSDTLDIMGFLLVASICFLIFQSERIGSLVIDILFEQLNVEIFSKYLSASFTTK